jgi:two-component system sensor kinase FixL
MNVPIERRDDVARILAAIVESSDDAIIGKDLAGTILSWNHGAERMYGYSAAEAVGRHIGLIVPPHALAELTSILERVAAGTRVRHCETVRLTKEGHLLDVSLSVSPILGEQGQIIGASAIARDISAEKKSVRDLQESEERLRSILESAVDAIVVVDSRGRMEMFNPAAERLFGYTAQEACGQNVTLLMPPPYRDEHDRYIASYLQTGIAKIIGIGRQVTGRRKDGSTFPVHLSVGEMVIGGERKFTGLLHDLSGRVRIEEQMREQASLVRLGEMAAVIAHEVKNPLAAIRGAIQVIGTRLTPGGREASVIGDIIGRIDALNQLVKDLLLFARPNRPNPRPVDISMLVATTATLFRQDSAHREVELTVSGHAPFVMADPDQLQIVFLNLFINSAQAMRERGMITVALTAEAGCCRAAVGDGGPGIPLEVLAKLFTPFVTTKARGTGLGLSTVKRLVEGQGGRVEVECPPEGGTVVTISLPLAAS